MIDLYLNFNLSRNRSKSTKLCKNTSFHIIPQTEQHCHCKSRNNLRDNWYLEVTLLSILHLRSGVPRHCSELVQVKSHWSNMILPVLRPVDIRFSRHLRCTPWLSYGPCIIPHIHRGPSDIQALERQLPSLRWWPTITSKTSGRCGWGRETASVTSAHGAQVDDFSWMACRQPILKQLTSQLSKVRQPGPPYHGWQWRHQTVNHRSWP